MNNSAVSVLVTFTFIMGGIIGWFSGMVSTNSPHVAQHRFTLRMRAYYEGFYVLAGRPPKSEDELAAALREDHLKRFLMLKRGAPTKNYEFIVTPGKDGELWFLGLFRSPGDVDASATGFFPNDKVDGIDWFRGEAFGENSSPLQE